MLAVLSETLGARDGSRRITVGENRSSDDSILKNRENEERAESNSRGSLEKSHIQISLWLQILSLLTA